nr:ORF 3 [Torque teno virus]
MCFNRFLETPARDPPAPVPVECLAQYKSMTRSTKSHSTSGTRGTSDVDSLARKVLRECQNNHQMLTLLQAGARDPREIQTGPKKGKTKKKTRLQSDESSSSGSTPVRSRAKKAKKKQPRRRSRKSYKNNSSSSSSWESSSDTSVSNSPKCKRGDTFTPFYNAMHK